jgi:hypothetical protein
MGGCLHYGGVTTALGVSGVALDTDIVIRSAVGPVGNGAVRELLCNSSVQTISAAAAPRPTIMPIIRSRPTRGMDLAACAGGAARRASAIRAVIPGGTAGAESVSVASRPRARRTRSSPGSVSPLCTD